MIHQNAQANDLDEILQGEKQCLYLKKLSHLSTPLR